MILNAYGINDIRQTEMHTVGPLVPECSFSMLKLLLKS